MPKPPLPPRAQHDAVAGLGEIGDERFAVLFEDLGPGRQLQNHVGALGAAAILSHAVAAPLRLEMLLIAIVEERIQIGDAFDDDIAALAAIAAVRSAELDEFLTAKADGAVAAIAGADIDLGLIEELHGTALETKTAPPLAEDDPSRLRKGLLAQIARRPQLFARRQALPDTPAMERHSAVPLEPVGEAAGPEAPGSAAAPDLARGFEAEL